MPDPQGHGCESSRRERSEPASTPSPEEQSPEPDREPLTRPGTWSRAWGEQILKGSLSGLRTTLPSMSPTRSWAPFSVSFSSRCPGSGAFDHWLTSIPFSPGFSARPALSCPLALSSVPDHSRSLCEVEREWSGILGVAEKEGRASVRACSGPGGRRATPLPWWLPSDASSADRSFGNRSGKSCASTADGVYSFLSSEVRSLESLRIRSSTGRNAAAAAVPVVERMRVLQGFVRFRVVLVLTYGGGTFCVRPPPSFAPPLRAADSPGALVRSQGGFVLDDEFRLGRPRLARLTAGSKPRRSSFSPACSSTPPASRNAGYRPPAGGARRAIPNPGRRRTP